MATPERIDVLAVMDAAVARLPDSEAAPLDEARTAVAELIRAAEGAEAFIGVMFGSTSGRVPETVDTPLGIPVKLGAIAIDLRVALSRAQGEG